VGGEADGRKGERAEEAEIHQAEEQQYQSARRETARPRLPLLISSLSLLPDQPPRPGCRRIHHIPSHTSRATRHICITLLTCPNCRGGAGDGDDCVGDDGVGDDIRSILSIVITLRFTGQRSFFIGQLSGQIRQPSLHGAVPSCCERNVPASSLLCTHRVILDNAEMTDAERL
jgi:hypothetical protein